MSELRERYAIVQEPRGDVYRHLLKFIGQFCTELLLVTRDPTAISPAARASLANLHGFLVGETDEEQWPGTKLIGHRARVYRYRLNPECSHLVSSMVEGLYDWISPDRPEDICILMESTPVLITIAHEREGYLDLTSGEFDELTRRKMGLVLHRGPIMPAGAEPYRLFGAFLDEDSLNNAPSIDAALGKYAKMAAPEEMEEVIVAIRRALFALKEDALLRIVLQRWGAAPGLTLRSNPSVFLNEVADKLEHLQKTPHRG